MGDAKTYCGWFGKASTTSMNNRLTVQFKTEQKNYKSRFSCTLNAVVSSCTCGKHNDGEKIVGGNEVSQF